MATWSCERSFIVLNKCYTENSVKKKEIRSIKEVHQILLRHIKLPSNIFVILKNSSYPRKPIKFPERKLLLFIEYQSFSLLLDNIAVNSVFLTETACQN